MQDIFVFNPRKEKYKKPIGAAEQGSSVALSVYASRCDVSTVSLLTFDDSTKIETSTPMTWCGIDKGFDVLECLFSAENPAIIWYCFELHLFDGKVLWFGKSGLSESKENTARFQLTVYSYDYSTPAWLADGVTYQIFVDRFNRSSESPKIEKDEYFFVHSDLSETPVYEPDENGIVQNRDIYGGNIRGIIEKISYLKSLGVKNIYLCPIFEAWSNHKYNTADYMKVDSHFGDENDLRELCRVCKKNGMRVILDGVFSHTGSDSIYFNKEHRYGNDSGAWNDVNSPYRCWYDIDADGKYSSWWGINTLPQVNELEPTYADFISGEKNSVISKWMDVGVAGWRLDVADELPDTFINEVKKCARSKSDDALIIGEVWEDASTKQAYGVNKKYFTDGILDGVMNYPIKNGIIAFLRNECTAQDAREVFESIAENYPKCSQRCLMNIIGTHDTVRALNELSVGAMRDVSKAQRAVRRLSEEELKTARMRIRQAAVLQYMFPGSPCIYYGDERGMEGFEDPFNRRYVNWKSCDERLLGFYKELGTIRTSSRSLINGDFSVIYAKRGVIAVRRQNNAGDMTVAVINRSKHTRLLKLRNCKCLETVLGGGLCRNGYVKVHPFSASVYSNEFYKHCLKDK